MTARTAGHVEYPTVYGHERGEAGDPAGYVRKAIMGIDGFKHGGLTGFLRKKLFDAMYLA